ncbi:MAG TPA: M4 family metallopeptidase [Actinophytocola sp.]|jgi:Zn-dependent metalloprotease|nr:M4 family metallopeptidase [Actinophytocola sp.]
MKRSTLYWAAAATVAVAVGATIGGNAMASTDAPTATHASKADARQLAKNESAKVATAAGIGSQEQLVVKDAVVTADGLRHMRYDRTYNGMKVLGGDMVVTESAKGEVVSVNKATQAKLTLSTTPGMAAPAAVSKAMAADTSIKYTAAKPSLVVYAVRTAPTLAYETVLNGMKADQTPSKLHVFTDAKTGKVLYSYDDIEQVAGTGNSEYSGQVALETTEGGDGFNMVDGTRGNQQVSNSDTNVLYTDADNTWGTGEGTDDQTAAVDAAYGAASTWDYYKNVHARNGIRNDGVGAESFVHYGDAYVNAFWDDSCFCMTYGDGIGDSHPLTAIDVAGHEMSHGVTAATAGLVYEGESGGLNEATSDIFGTAVEFSTNNATDPGDYLIGEKIDINGDGSPLRYMDDPTKDGASLGCWSTDAGNVDVHYSSGIANHFFYMLSEGSGAKNVNGVDYNSPTCDGSTVTGIGRESAEKIWYNALSTKFTSTTDYHDARTQTIAAADELFGAGSAESTAVAATWAAVAVS